MYDTKEILQAITVCNSHAKAATKPQKLYFLKKRALEKLIHEGRVEKVGLTYSKNHKFSQQQIDVSVKCDCGEYYFHTPSTKEDLRTLPHIKIKHRNPNDKMPLRKAKDILIRYISR